MHLSRLEIFGFKSFAKKLDLKLTGGLTAIVGPNGCGKTNIVDAIRWVLGEQRPTQIRLEKMEDVIFKGSSTRRPLGMSEVSLTIDNNSGILPLNMPEITVTRRLFRSGESEYLLNKKICRLADLSELFMDTGLGTNSYSLFELSMINSILSDKTEDRRRIFEEAAGITKYKARRKSALAKLSGIEDDLLRVGDIVAELKRRSDSLKRQASKAVRYRELKSELKERTLFLAAVEIEKHKGTIAQASEKIDDFRQSMEKLKSLSVISASAFEELAVEIVDTEKEYEDKNSACIVSQEKINLAEKELLRIEARLESLAETVVRARETQRSNRISLEKLAVSNGECAEALSETSAKLENMESARVTAATKEADLRDKAAACNLVCFEAEKECRRAETELAVISGAVEKARIQRVAEEKRVSEISSRIDLLNTTAAQLKNSIIEDRNRKNDRALREEKILNELSSSDSAFAEKSEESSKLGERLGSKKEKLAALRAERDLLEKILVSREGYSEGVKKAFGNDSLNGRLKGVLADIISVEEKYALAVEAALSESAYHILVDTTEDAIYGAQQMGGSGGRAVFLPLDSFGEDTSCEPPFFGGVIGLACSFLKAEERYLPAVKGLIGDVVVVGDLESAIELHSKAKDWRFVTLEGEMVGVHGEVFSSTKKQPLQGAALGRSERLKYLSSSADSLEKEIETLANRLNDISRESLVLKDTVEIKKNALDACRKEASQLDNSLTQAETRLENVQESLESLLKEQTGINIPLEEDQEETGNTSFNDAEERLKCHEDNLRTRRAELESANSELEKARAETSSIEIERASLVERKAGLIRELAVIEERREALALSSGQVLHETEQAELEMLSSGEKKNNLTAQLDSLSALHSEMILRKDEAERKLADLRSLKSEREKDFQGLRREMDELSRQESSVLLGRDEALMKMRNITERLRDEFFMETVDLPQIPGDSVISPEEEKVAIDELRRRLYGLGDVNLAAEADYEEEKKRLDFLEKEQKDLIDAGNVLKETINRINQIARSRFLECFEKIRQNFKAMFEEFFPGGICELELAAGEDPLETEIGISARPTGKNVKTINLLSSGERALTAIALLFAIYLVKPSPFCILDEIDAPLDDVNIGRYLKVIRDFSKKTQFIIVTHNKKTMSAADNLYGITMEEPGLSTMVSVRLNEMAS